MTRCDIRLVTLGPLRMLTILRYDLRGGFAQQASAGVQQSQSRWFYGKLARDGSIESPARYFRSPHSSINLRKRVKEKFAVDPGADT